MFELSIRDTHSGRGAGWLPGWLPPLAGLAAAGCVAWWTRPAPAPNSLSWAGVAALGTRYFLLSAAAGLAVIAVSDRRLLFHWRILAAMVWLPPLALFVGHNSPWATLAAVVVGWQVAKLKRFSPRALSAADSAALVPSLEALASAACVTGGILTAILAWHLASAACFGTGSAFVAWAASKQKAVDEAEPTRGALLPVVFAAAFTLASLTPYLQAGAAGEVAGPGRSGAEPLRDYEKDVPGQLGGIYRGVILVPAPIPHQVTAPPVASLKHSPSTRKRTEPFSIPFFGVYWMFRFPQSEPPPQSYVARGSPLTLVFRSSDRFPLTEEARQNFGTPIDLDCCSKIQLAIRTADLHSRFIALELIVVDTAEAGKPWVSLGQGAVVQAANWQPETLPVEVRMDFDVPRSPKIRQFDEAIVRFHPRYLFATASSKVSIDRFVFVPRGF